MSSTDSVMRALYNDKLMAFANDIPLQHRLEEPDATVQRRSPLCGSRITVDLKVEGGKVADYGHVVRACTLGQAAASIMARRVIGEETGVLLAIAEAVRQMLKDGVATKRRSMAGVAGARPGTRIQIAARVRAAGFRSR